MAYLAHLRCAPDDVARENALLLAATLRLGKTTRHGRDAAARGEPEQLAHHLDDALARADLRAQPLHF